MITLKPESFWNTMPEFFNDFIVGRNPAGRWGEPSDLQGVTIFLSSKASDFVSG